MRRGIIYIDESYVEFGPISTSNENILILFEGGIYTGSSYDELKDHLGFDYLNGYYVIGKDRNQHHFPLGRDKFPYNLDRYNYNAKHEEHLFKDKQIISNLITFKYINELPFTFGLEFETAGGYLPQHSLYELGLIPLRDGSISGIEFATVVLQGNLGLNLLKKQVETLNAYTIFDKDCSLHVHLGNFKLDGKTLLTLNNIFYHSNIRNFVPSFTFDTTKYKTNTNKNYCEYNPLFASFEDMYRYLVGKSFYGSFTQPHPKDIEGTKKWNIKSRYSAVNFINALCYKGPKTIEFRMMRPTYNFNKILGWLFIYGAFIKYAEMNNNVSFLRRSVSIENIVQSVYSDKLAEILIDFLRLSKLVLEAQTSVHDYYGMRVDIEDKIINYQSFGKNFY